ncbi:Uncharacterised protein [Bordetella pertussis]|nr:Uncharacterised protein [Bordetella pertussis]
MGSGSATSAARSYTPAQAASVASSSANTSPQISSRLPAT